MTDYPDDKDSVDILELKCSKCFNKGQHNLIILSRKKINRTNYKLTVRCLVCSTVQGIIVK